ncbi:hypothetical protein BAE44_0006731 [Dichanthelium oligosanthes]|uniref:WRKY domain-containing protein n=1 Tax=Dichanthelium oligosanthes TaxID=888268 RepID=A0A1E5W4A4_9POAL|nr:hypothetical protein BAE44_0006731 [Dichanthelium oligosanthes]
MASPRLKRKQQPSQPYGQGGLFGLSPPLEPAPRHGRKTRLYFRCSYREDRHCPASKLVQQVSHHDPPLFEVTYMHEHTCNAAPVPTPDVMVQNEAPAPNGGLVLWFGSSSGGHHHRDVRMQLQGEQQQQQYHHSPSPLLMTNFDYSNNSQQHAFPSRVPPFPIIESSSPTPQWTDDDDDILTWDWDSFTCDLDDHLQFSDDGVHFPGM